MGPDAGCAPCLTVARVWRKAGVCCGTFVIGISDLGRSGSPVLQPWLSVSRTGHNMEMKSLPITFKPLVREPPPRIWEPSSPAIQVNSPVTGPNLPPDS
jgi:hypothetical protein